MFGRRQSSLLSFGRWGRFWQQPLRDSRAWGTWSRRLRRQVAGRKKSLSSCGAGQQTHRTRSAFTTRPCNVVRRPSAKFPRGGPSGMIARLRLQQLQWQHLQTIQSCLCLLGGPQLLPPHQHGVVHSITAVTWAEIRCFCPCLWQRYCHMLGCGAPGLTTTCSYVFSHQSLSNMYPLVSSERKTQVPIKAVASQYMVLFPTGYVLWKLSVNCGKHRSHAFPSFEFWFWNRACRKKSTLSCLHFPAQCWKSCILCLLRCNSRFLQCRTPTF